MAATTEPSRHAPAGLRHDPSWPAIPVVLLATMLRLGQAVTEDVVAWVVVQAAGALPFVLAVAYRLDSFGIAMLAVAGWLATAVAGALADVALTAVVSAAARWRGRGVRHGRRRTGTAVDPTEPTVP